MCDGDRVRIVIDRTRLEGTVDLVGEPGRPFISEEAAQVLSTRPPHPVLSPDPQLPDETRLWAALQQIGGGTWGGCVYDVEGILGALEASRGAEVSSRGLDAAKPVHSVTTCQY